MISLWQLLSFYQCQCIPNIWEVAINQKHQKAEHDWNFNKTLPPLYHWQIFHKKYFYVICVKITKWEYHILISFSFFRCPKTDTTSISSTLCQTSTCWPPPSTGPAGSLWPPSPRTSGTAPGRHLMGPGGVMSLLWTSLKKTPSMFIFMMFNILSGKTLLDYQVYFLFLVWCFT